MDATLQQSNFFLIGGTKEGPKDHPLDGFFTPLSFMILKSLYQDVSNLGTNFFLNLADLFNNMRTFGLLQQFQN